MANTAPNIGVLALQGNFQAHVDALNDLGIHATLIKTAASLRTVHGIIIPGGESTTMLKLMEPENLLNELRDFYHRGNVIFGTCAGIILLAKDTTPKQASCNLLNAHVTRNAYGRQINSCETIAQVIDRSWSQKTLAMMLIRAPQINHVDDSVNVIATYQSSPVLIEQDRLLACTFHPEMTPDRSVHQYFIEKTRQNRGHT